MVCPVSGLVRICALTLGSLTELHCRPAKLLGVRVKLLICNALHVAVPLTSGAPPPRPPRQITCFVQFPSRRRSRFSPLLIGQNSYFVQWPKVKRRSGRSQTPYLTRKSLIHSWFTLPPKINTLRENVAANNGKPLRSGRFKARCGA